MKPPAAPVLYADPLGRVRSLDRARRTRGGRVVVGRIISSDVAGEAGMWFIGPTGAQPHPARGPSLWDLLRGPA